MVRLVQVTRNSYEMSRKGIGRGEIVEDHNQSPNQPIHCLIFSDKERTRDPIGVILYRHLERGETRLTKLIEIEIFTRFRGRGHGRQALKKLICFAKEHRSVEIQLIVFNHRRIAMQLYEKMGFRKEKEFEKSSKLVLGL